MKNTMGSKLLNEDFKNKTFSLSARDTFFNKIFSLVKSGEDIFIVTSDLGAPSLDDFRKYYPERYISVGIAEQSLISIAAGLSLSGKKVVAYGLNPFPVTRAFDQVRSLLAELKIPITLCGLNAGLCSALAGYTHMPVEDMGMVRMLSNVRMFNPSDTRMAEKLAKEVPTCTYPRYIRFDKAVNEAFYDEEDIDLHTGFTTYGQPGNLCIITFGCFVSPVRKMIKQHGGLENRVQLIDLFGLPADTEKLIKHLQSAGKILTIEENVLAGGIGSYILEILSDYGIFKPVKRLGLRFENGYYDVFTSREYIRKNQGFTESDIERVILEMV